jgi:hypothetical protein
MSAGSEHQAAPSRRPPGNAEQSPKLVSRTFRILATKIFLWVDRNLVVVVVLKRRDLAFLRLNVLLRAIAAG